MNTPKALSMMAELEKAAIAFKQALDAAEPASDWLEGAKYYGAESLSHWWGELLTPLDYVIEDLVDLRETRRDTLPPV